MRPMAFVIHRVIIIVDYIVSMMRECISTIPQMVGQILMVIVDTRINDSNHYTGTSVTLRPNFFSVHLCDIRRDFT